MTIYGVGYRSLDYEVEPRHKRWWPVLVREFRTLFGNKWGVFLFIACLLPALASLTILLLQMGVLRIGNVDFEFSVMMDRVQPLWRDSTFNARSVLFYVEPVYGWGFLPFLVMSSWVSSRGIAKDKQTNALEIYWTRGIGPVEYFLAKWLGSAFLIGLLFVVAPLVLWILGVFMAEDWSFLQETIGFMPAALLSTALFTLVLTYMPTAISAMSKRPNLAVVLWLFLIVGSAAVGNILRLILRDDSWVFLSPWESMRRLVQWMCGVEPSGFTSFSPGAALASVLFYVGALTVFAVRRLRLREAVA